MSYDVQKTTILCLKNSGAFLVAQLTSSLSNFCYWIQNTPKPFVTSTSPKSIDANAQSSFPQGESLKIHCCQDG